MVKRLKCKSCGGDLKPGDTSCRYCGAEVASAKQFPEGASDSVTSFGADKGEPSHVHFGDGKVGDRPSGGPRIRAAYRAGEGTISCLKCGLVQSKSRETCRACGAKLVKRRLHRRVPK